MNLFVAVAQALDDQETDRAVRVHSCNAPFEATLDRAAAHGADPSPTSKR
jgi:hypothetical protein